MNVTLWIIQVLLAVVFAATGALKLSRPRMALAGSMSWVVHATDAQVKTLGALELLAAIGLVAPPLTHIATFLTPLAALGVVFLMVGATVTHLRMHEPERVWVTGLLMVLAAFVAVARFAVYPL